MTSLKKRSRRENISLGLPILAGKALPFRYLPRSLEKFMVGNLPNITADVLSDRNTPSKVKKDIRESGATIIELKGDSKHVAGAGHKLILLGNKLPTKIRLDVIAHELGHIRHRSLDKSLAVGAAGMVLGGAAGHKLAPKSVIAPLVGGYLGGLLTTKAFHSEFSERAADRRAAQLLGANRAKRHLVSHHLSGGVAYDKRLEPVLRLVDKQDPGLVVKAVGGQNFGSSATGKWYTRHFRRPTHALGRGYSRTRAALLTEHPPLWSRIEYLDKLNKS